MEQEKFLALDEVAQKDIAIAYLLKNKNEIPIGLEKLFNKLDDLESTAYSIMMAVQEAKRTIQTLSPKSEQLSGSMGTIADLIADELSEEQIMEFGLKHDVPARPTSEPDMAGSTAKIYNSSNPVPSQNGSAQ